MPGSLDGIRISKSGLLAHRTLLEVVSNNIANASNKAYSRQVAQVTTNGALPENQYLLGQGVHVQKVIRVRDELLDEQIRDTFSSKADEEVQLKWLSRIQSVYNEPSESGIANALTKFWEAFNDLSNNPKELAPRQNLIEKTKNLSQMNNTLATKLEEFKDELDQDLRQVLDQINQRTTEIAQLNEAIFELEAGKNSPANDLRDKRDAALDTLSGLIGITYYETENGMVNVFIGEQFAVDQNRSEDLVVRNNPLDTARLEVMWACGDNNVDTSRGEIHGILHIRDTILPDYQAELNDFASTLISQVNRIYANGVGLDPETLIESNYGYQALGVDSETEALNLVDGSFDAAFVPSGDFGSIKISFYDSDGKIVRSSGVLIEASDSLEDIQTKLDAITGLTVTLVPGDENNPEITDERLRIQFDEGQVAGSSLGEVSFAVSDNTGGFDTSGFLKLVGFDQTSKSDNDSLTVPTLTGLDLNTLTTELEVNDLAEVLAKPLNLSGTFTLNAFETMTETGGLYNGFLSQQFSVEVESTDSIQDVIDKVNLLTADYGVEMTVTAGVIGFSSTAWTDEAGTVHTDPPDTFGAGVNDNYLRLSFANTYQFPKVSEDVPPANYNGLGDNTNFFGQIQLNTLFSGQDATDISLDSKITSASMIHAGSKLDTGNNSIAQDLFDLQFAQVAENNEFTLNDSYENIITQVGTNVQMAAILSANEEASFESFIKERDSISGVNLDEELANMIMFQRAYDSNARMISTFNEMIVEILNI